MPSPDEFYRIKRLPPYVFAEVNRLKAECRADRDIPPPPATMFAWAPVPEPFARLGSMEFAKLLLTEAEVAVSPGEGFVRIGLVENGHRIRQAARGVKRLMQRADEILSRYTQLKEASA